MRVIGVDEQLLAKGQVVCLLESTSHAIVDCRLCGIRVLAVVAPHDENLESSADRDTTGIYLIIYVLLLPLECFHRFSVFRVRLRFGKPIIFRQKPKRTGKRRFFHDPLLDAHFTSEIRMEQKHRRSSSRRNKRYRSGTP